MRGTAVALLVAALALPAAADTVHLLNGNKFEQVVAEPGRGEVRILMPHGEIVLPAKLVARVERSPSVWRRFAEREAALRATGSSASDWLDLAIWTDRAGYPAGMRQALLRAADLDPELDGLPPLMARIGYILDDEAGRWLAEADYMHRRGYRLWADRWLPQEEYAARLRAQQEAEERRREDARQERLARAIEALVAAQLAEAATPEPARAQTRGPLVAVYSGGYFPVASTAVVLRPVKDPEQATFEDLVNRQPGSLFPVRPRRHLTSSD